MTYFFKSFLILVFIFIFIFIFFSFFFFHFLFYNTDGIFFGSQWFFGIVNRRLLDFSTCKGMDKSCFKSTKLIKKIIFTY